MIPFSNNKIKMQITIKGLITFLQKLSIFSQIPIYLNSTYSTTEIGREIIPVHDEKGNIGVLNIRLQTNSINIPITKNI